jgi:hypothetical protein
MSPECAHFFSFRPGFRPNDFGVFYNAYVHHEHGRAMSYREWMESAWDSVCAQMDALSGYCADMYAAHTRAEEYRQIKSDNDIASSIAELRDVRAQVAHRLQELREEESAHHASVLLELGAGREDEARASLRLRMMYRAQVMHTTQTATAIEAHMIALEGHLINVRVVRALKGAGRSDSDAEEAAEDVSDHAAERCETTTRIMMLLRDVPSVTVSEEAVDTALAGISSRPASLPAGGMPLVPDHVPCRHEAMAVPADKKMSAPVTLCNGT